MNKLITTGLSIATAAVMLHQSALAQTAAPATRNCVFLREVSTRQRTIRKVINLNNLNANTDFAVPPGTRFNSYIARVIPENNSRYQIDVSLKYNNGSSSKMVSRSIEARRFFLYSQPFLTPTNRQAFQVNTRIAGSRNTAYQVSVLGCQ